MSIPVRMLGASGGSTLDLREHNLSRILLSLNAESPLSRAQLAERTGLGITAMTKLVGELRHRGFVRESAEGTQGIMGRPVQHVSLAGNRWSTASLNLDNGAIHVGVGGIDGRCTRQFTVATAPSLDIDAYMSAVDSALAEVAEENFASGRELLALEVAVPGAVNSATGEMTRSILNGWPSAYPLRAALLDCLDAKERGVSESVLVGVDRSTNYSLLGLLGAAPDSTAADTVALLGGIYAVSGGIYTRSAIEHGSTGFAGDFGHFVIDPAGVSCWCGRRGCVETRIGLAGIYARSTDGQDSAGALVPQLALRHEDLVSELLDRASSGDRRVLEELDTAGYWLGITVDTISSIVNPNQLLIDGYLSALSAYLEPSMEALLASIGKPPSVADLGVTFTDVPFAPVNLGMHVAAGLAVAANPDSARRQ